MNNNFTFLTYDQVLSDSPLDIIKKYGKECIITDFSALLGAITYHCDWWLRTTHGPSHQEIVSSSGTGDYETNVARAVGARPAIPYHIIENMARNKTVGSSGVVEVEYGEYPQTMVTDKTLYAELEEHYSKIGDRGNLLHITGKSYTTDSVDWTLEHVPFEPREHTEYEYKGKKYVRIVGDNNSYQNPLSDGTTGVVGASYWVAVEPIKWLVDETADIALSEKILFSGVQFHNGNVDNFDKADIKKFMDQYFSKDIIQNSNLANANTATNGTLSNMEMTLLTKDQVFDPTNIDLFNNYSRYAKCTGLSIALGAKPDDQGDCHYWLASDNSNNIVAPIVTSAGGRAATADINHKVGIRPVVPYSAIKELANIATSFISYPNLMEVSCGKYPQEVVTGDLYNKLNMLYSNDLLHTTGNVYTFMRKEGSNDRFVPVVCFEYEYNGSRYVCFKQINGTFNIADDPDLPFPNEVTFNDGDIVWVKVLPIAWLVDKNADIAVTKEIILSGMRYNSPNNTNINTDFTTTELYKYLNTMVKRDIFSNQNTLSNNNQNNTAFYFNNDTNGNYINTDNTIPAPAPANVAPVSRKDNPYNFNFDEVSEEDIIRGAVESNVAVFLHGRSSEGKSARVKQLDPDCEIIYMITATPDSLNGKTALNSATGEMVDVPPTWYTNLKEKCEKEPDKIHIVFFDELTNAFPSIQGMAFNIVLDGEVAGKWKLPPNARVVAAGNEMQDSLAANPLVQPLYNRFAHVYIETDVDSWLKWASTPEEDYQKIDYTVDEKAPKIHPAIYAFIAYKSYSGDDVLRTEYTGEKPNADPRKWEMASKVLTKTKKPEMIRALVGEEITRDFVEFTKRQVITVEDVINNNYNEADLTMDTAQKFATAVGLSSVDEEHFKEVRDFMKKLGAEPRAAFESMWAHGDKKRLELIAELQLLDISSANGRGRGRP